MSFYQRLLYYYVYCRRFCLSLMKNWIISTLKTTNLISYLHEKWSRKILIIIMEQTILSDNKLTLCLKSLDYRISLMNFECFTNAKNPHRIDSLSLSLFLFLSVITVDTAAITSCSLKETCIIKRTRSTIVCVIHECVHIQKRAIRSYHYNRPRSERFSR